ncbi:IclR family transcriptional regulator C-terminal domain-containing protein [Mesorhizobium sp. ANAO-SY3R2]|uniref:IclR family transcriptional regulator domain-containing protein n=1 Tax=Mesorhizobium sp. ANAO-SY3R2 TaxID=3166644 RepID=UPI00366B89A4
MGTPKNNSVLKAFDILNAVAAGPGAMTPGEIAEASGLNLSTAHRFLLTLEEIGAISRLPGNRYSLGMMVAELGRRVTRNDIIAERARGIVENLSESLGETVSLATFDGFQINFVVWSEPQRALVFSIRRDRPMPIHASALGKVFLAGLPSMEREELLGKLDLPPLTTNTQTELVALRREVAEVARLGHARDRQEMELGLDCVAVPIKNADGETIAAISVSAPSTRMNDGNIDRFLQPLIEAAARVCQSVLIENKILPDKAKPRGSYPHVKRVRDFAFVSGISARRADDSFAGAKVKKSGEVVLDIYQQTIETIRNVADVLASVGASLADVVEIEAYLIDMEHYARFNEAYGRFFDSEGPTRTTVAVRALPHPHQLLMMKATAHVSPALEELRPAK